MKGNETILLDKDSSVSSDTAAEGDKQRSFAFDHSFWSCNPQDAGFASSLSLQSTDFFFSFRFFISFIYVKKQFLFLLLFSPLWE